MPIGHSKDLRERTLNLIERGTKITQVAKLLEISRASIYRWIDHRETRGTLEPMKNYQKGHSHKVKDQEAFKDFVKQNQGLSAIQMSDKLGDMTPKTVRLWLKRVGFTRKKRLTATKNEVKKSVIYIWTV